MSKKGSNYIITSTKTPIGIHHIPSLFVAINNCLCHSVDNGYVYINKNCCQFTYFNTHSILRIKTQ